MKKTIDSIATGVFALLWALGAFLGTFGIAYIVWLMLGLPPVTSL